MSVFFETPRGSIISTARVGALRATERGLLILGTSPDELLEYVECPPDVAVAWRDQLSVILLNPHSSRRSDRPDWGAIAYEANPGWARQQGIAPAGAAVATDSLKQIDPAKPVSGPAIPARPGN